VVVAGDSLCGVSVVGAVTRLCDSRIEVADMIHPTVWTKLKVRVLGRAFAGYWFREYNRYLRMYWAKCGTHGYFLDYPSGWHDRLDCPECLKRDLIRFSKELDGLELRDQLLKFRGGD
jgi:hypothetical protein